MLADPRNPNSLSAKLRARRDVGLRYLIASIKDAKGSVSVLDLGGTFEYWQRVGLQFLVESNVTVTLLNLHRSEISNIENHRNIFNSETGDACHLQNVPTKKFDLAHSNSVIEHVLTWGNMKAFASETRRVAHSYYVQTPYYWFPFDPHFYKVPLFHWLPRPIRASLLTSFPIAHVGKLNDVDSASEVLDHARLLDLKQFRFLFPDAQIAFERFGGFPKSMIAIRE